jgi:tetratricopeptide (TPR) repeat protein
VSYESVNLHEIEARQFPAGGAAWRPVRERFGIQSFGVNAWVAAEAGQTVINEHDETGRLAREHEELYLVTRGHATFTVDGDEIDAPTGTLVYVGDPASKRAAHAREADTEILVFGGKPGEAFAVAPWEHSAQGVALLTSGDNEAARTQLAEAHEHFPEHGGILYNLACAESLLGDSEAAVGHIRRALELDERLAEFARQDPDLDSIRDDPRFPRAPAEAEAGG